jgi:peroxiredoxin
MRGLNTERLLQIIIGVLVIGLVVVVGNTIHERIISVGDRAPKFTVVTDDGRTLTRSEFGGKILVLNFWATWCAPCIAELPSLNEFHRRLSGSGIVVLGISVDRNEKVYRDFLKRAGVSFATARDPEAEIPASYGTYKYPETYVINSRGEVLEKFIADHNWADENLIKRIQSLL